MRKLLIALGALAVAGVGVAPALAHTPGTGSHEEDEVVVACDNGDGTTSEPSADGTCPEGTTPITETQWDNEVTCGPTDEDDVSTSVVNISTRDDGTGTGGTVEACADDSNGDAVLQGRIIATGNASDGGYVAADGDQSNDPADSDDNPLDGWARVDVGSDGSVTVRCGDTAGNQDATHPTADDTQDDCGS